MAKKKTEASELPEVEAGTAVAIIKPAFEVLSQFKMPDVEESIAIIAKKRTENTTLVIDGVEDKEGYEAVKKGMGQMKNDRIAFVNAATENVITPATEYLDQFKKDLAKIVDEFKAGEQDLRTKKDFIDNEKIRLKAEAELEKVRVMQIRVNDLNVLGAVFDGKLYTFPYNEMVMITAGDIKDLDDEKFGAFRDNVQVLFNQETERKRLAQEAKDEAENERLLEANRVDQQNLKNQQEAEALVEKRTKLRLKEIKLAGAVPNGDDWLFPDQGGYELLSVTLEELDDATWDEFIYDMEHFTPAEEPLVKEAPYVETSQAATFNPDSHLNQRIDPDNIEPETLAEVLTEVGLVEETLRFDKEEPFEDIQLSKKHCMRIYPDQYETLALDGIKEVGGQGKIQSLNWVILPVR